MFVLTSDLRRCAFPRMRAIPSDWLKQQKSFMFFNSEPRDVARSVPEPRAALESLFSLGEQPVWSVWTQNISGPDRAKSGKHLFLQGYKNTACVFVFFHIFGGQGVLFDEKTVVAFQWEPMRGTGAQCGLRRECVRARECDCSELVCALFFWHATLDPEWFEGGGLWWFSSPLIRMSYCRHLFFPSCGNRRDTYHSNTHDSVWYKRNLNFSTTTVSIPLQETINYQMCLTRLRTGRT